MSREGLLHLSMNALEMHVDISQYSCDASIIQSTLARTCPCLQVVDYRMLSILATLAVVLILPFFAHVIYALYV